MTTTTITLAPFIIKSLQWLLALLLIDYTAVTIATLIDLKSGIKKCRRLNIPCTSRGYRRTIDKLSRYYTTLMSLTTIDAMLTATAMLLQLLLSAKHDNALPTISKIVVWSLFILDKPPY